MFLGGGTPSLFPPAAIARILAAARAHLALAADAGVSIADKRGAVERWSIGGYCAEGA